MREVVIVSSARTAGGKFQGSLQRFTAPEIGAAAVKEVIRRAGISPDTIDQTVFGSAWQAGIGPNPARLASVMGGVSVNAPAVSVNVRCGSSLQALIFGAQAIKAGDADTVLVGGTESTSNVPYALPGARDGYRMGDGQLVDLMHKDGFRCPLGGGLMGEITEPLATEYDISRREQDEYAAASHNTAEAAVKEGRFKDEVVPFEIKGKKGDVSFFEKEEIFREGATADGMGKLPPVFKKDGTITAGNACALCDAAAAQVLMERGKARSMGITPLALLRSYAFVGVDPKRFGLSPVKAINKALEIAKLKLGDIELIELNEAFALQYLACERELKLDRTKVNVNGGAIALGHPVAATGSKILTTLLYAMKHRNATLGLVSLCIGGGNGVAAVVERL
ncbi:MAG: acetyl-CoA C-acyltransferase [Deltaproteobacteria bacterium]|nr:acetyl-CoA C-acyltransferase [Deltaproteobacteria bacterium]